jgi:nucleoid-associated protein YgaU
VLVSESPSNESSAAKTKQRVASLPQRPDPPAPTIGDSDYSGIAAHASPVRIPNDPAERVDSSPEGDERIRFHRLVDGDDLAALAARYLGDRGRAEEILTLNSDVLQRPDLLPLGKVIRIPPLNSTPAMPRSADPNADEELQTNTRLAPIR